jgi:hypothetical protein
MKRTHLIAVLAGVLAAGIFTADASAYYHPTMGRFMQRDPGAGAGGPMRVGDGGPVVGGGFIPRDQYADGMSMASQEPTPVTANFGRPHVGVNVYPSLPTSMPEPDGANMYQYVRSNPVNAVDPEGLKACRLEPLLEHDCCQCLLYSEAGGSTGCLVAYAWVMHNRQRTNWPEFNRERSFCDQAATGPASKRVAWAGGEGSKRYEACCVCLNNAVIPNPPPDPDECCPLSEPEAEPALRAGYVCSQVQAGAGQDPTGGAQYVGTRGAVTNVVGAHNIPNPCKLFQIPGCTSWFANCSKRPLAKP